VTVATMFALPKDFIKAERLKKISEAGRCLQRT
jgi:hypothetical protein